MDNNEEKLSEKVLEELQSFCSELKDTAREIIQRELSGEMDVETKPDKSFVTSIDKAIEKVHREKIQKKYPTHGVIGEEFGELSPDAEFVWTLDPIDGTEELVFGTPLYGTIISLLHRGRPVLGLIDHAALDLCTVGGMGIGVYSNGKRLKALSQVKDTPRLYIGSRHQFLRGDQDHSHFFEKASKLYPNVRVFCTCYGFTSLIHDQADVAVEYNLKVWDLAAPEVLIREVGGEFVKFGEHQENGLTLYGAVFGKKEAVENVISHLKVSGIYERCA